jgi:hypothetical protein
MSVEARAAAFKHRYGYAKPGADSAESSENRVRKPWHNHRHVRGRQHAVRISISIHRLRIIQPRTAKGPDTVPSMPQPPQPAKVYPRRAHSPRRPARRSCRLVPLCELSVRAVRRLVDFTRLSSFYWKVPHCGSELLSSFPSMSVSSCI